MRVFNLDKRLKSLENTLGMNEKDYPGAQFVGRYYDELTTEERFLWLTYHDSLITDRRADVKAFEEVMTWGGDYPERLHFVCDKRVRAPTHEEFIERVHEVQKYIEESAK